MTNEQPVLQLADTLYWRNWDGDTVVYDTVTGDTHLLQGLGADVFTCLAENDMDVNGLASELAEYSIAGDERQRHQRICHTLAEFRRLGLISGDVL